jgi:hypothetical protein
MLTELHVSCLICVSFPKRIAYMVRQLFLDCNFVHSEVDKISVIKVCDTI